MQMETHLFLFGGGPPFTGKLARQFCEKALRPSCTILVMPRPGWENYQSVYADKLAEYGLKCAFIPLGQVPVNEAVEQINQAGAIVIGGGNTERYIDEVVETPIGEALKKTFSSRCASRWLFSRCNSKYGRESAFTARQYDREIIGTARVRDRKTYSGCRSF